MMSPILSNIVNTIVESVHPERVILFGSRSRRDYRKDSDYDFMVIKRGIKNEREISRRIYKALFAKKIGLPVDVIVVDAQKLKANRRNSSFFYSSALSEGKVLYG